MALLFSLRSPFLCASLRFGTLFLEGTSQLPEAASGSHGGRNVGVGTGRFLVEGEYNLGRGSVVRAIDVSLPESSGLFTVRFQIGTRPVRFSSFCLFSVAIDSDFDIILDGNLGSSVFSETDRLQMELESLPECATCPEFDFWLRCFAGMPFSLLLVLDHFAS